MHLSNLDSMNVKIGDVFTAIDHMCDMENQYCKRYCELNPDDSKEREHDCRLINSELIRAKYEILKQCNLA